MKTLKIILAVLIIVAVWNTYKTEDIRTFQYTVAGALMVFGYWIYKWVKSRNE